MAYLRLLALAILAVTLGGSAAGASEPGSGTPMPASSKPRVVVTTDPELDDSNSLVRYLLYSTDFRTEGLIYASSQFHWKGDGTGKKWFVPGREYTRFGLNLGPMESWRWAPGERFIDDAVETYEFVDEIVGGAIPREFIPACDKGFKEGVKKGALIGFPVVGVRCTITDGLHHPVDSSEQAFRTAALMGFREAYMGAKPTILEPIMKVEVQAPEEFQGTVMGQINQRRGVIIGSENAEGYVIATAEVPLNEMFGYSTDLRSGTQGKGEFTMEFLKYAAVPKQEQEVLMAEYKQKQAAERK